MMKQDLRIKELEQELAKREEEIEQLKNRNYALADSISGLKDEVYKYEELVHSSKSLIAIFMGEDHVIDIANESIREVWGKGHDVIGKPLLELLPELKSQGIKELLDQVYQTGIAYHADELPIELVIDGKPEIRYFDFTYQPQKNIDGEIIGVADIATDVTKQTLLNKKIKKNGKEFRELVNFMPHKITHSDPEGNTLYCNQSWLDYTGKTEEQFIEEPWTSLIHPEDKAETEKMVGKSLGDGSEIDLEVRLLDYNGEYKWHLCRATCVKDEEGNISSWISSSTEIQKLKEEEELKEGFLKLVSHELKTPVTSIKGYVQLLLSILSKESSEVNKSVSVKPYLNRIETQVERLIRLISEMLDLSRIEQNELKLKPETFNINQHVEEIIEDITFSNKEIQIKLDNHFECDVSADKDRIGQVIINFITNAYKYSPEDNRVDVKIWKCDDEFVAITVLDHGIGINQNEIHQIFKKFYRVPGDRDETYAGFGIGLFLSNNIIERHNGKINVKSEFGKGSEFTFTLPIKQTN
ncbi:ATP-binding protein [Christiangramia sediminicola]|uniref:histidine kinase n=1 Tax=Christiangramia sediminicola TaxID=3073267 RepID=A0ABU1EPJ4_9FLAO|nr:ATP-binding protein [Christiangramia sp. SM2212]MDR5590305.1 ATP-binding protein [Christiangramia sp. SM2212]